MLRQRVLTAVILALAFIAATTALSPFGFSVFIALVLLAAAWEWCDFIGLSATASRFGYLATLALTLLALCLFFGVSPSARSLHSDRIVMILVLGLLFWVLVLFMLKAYPANVSRWNQPSRIALMGLLALAPAWAGIVQLKYLQPAGYLVLALVILVAVADISAYFVGRALGRTPLAPVLSPNKSWEGVWGGLAACTLAGPVFIWFMYNFMYSGAVEPGLARTAVLWLLCFCITPFDVIGDLLESMLKRNRNLKDSGSILPGHGGLLDRVDGLLAVTPVFVLTLLLIS